METITLNISRLLGLFGKITAGSDDEIELIKRYSYVVDTKHNTYKEFYNYLTAKGYHYDGDYDELEVRNFYKIKKLNDSIEKFVEILEYLLLNKIDPYFENITYDSIVSYTETELLVKFNVEK